jgi:hypothetical protein
MTPVDPRTSPRPTGNFHCGRHVRRLWRLLTESVIGSDQGGAHKVRFVC